MQSEDNSEWTEFLCQSLSCSMWFKRAGANSRKCFINGFISYKTNAKTILQQHNIGLHEFSLWQSLLSLLLKDNSITNLHYKVIKTHNDMCFGAIVSFKGHRKETIACNLLSNRNDPITVVFRSLHTLITGINVLVILFFLQGEMIVRNASLLTLRQLELGAYVWFFFFSLIYTGLKYACRLEDVWKMTQTVTVWVSDSIFSSSSSPPLGRDLLLLPGCPPLGNYSSSI